MLANIQLSEVKKPYTLIGVLVVQAFGIFEKLPMWLVYYWLDLLYLAPSYVNGTLKVICCCQHLNYSWLLTTKLTLGRREAHSQQQRDMLPRT